MKSAKKWCICLLLTATLLSGALGMATAIIDPYFHYHGPLNGLEYPINEQRYQNDGITRNFKYDAIITGTSMTENFRASEFDSLFGYSSIKIPFSGGSYKEINDSLKRATTYNPDVKVILRGLDYNMLLESKEAMNYEIKDYPDYLYDAFIFNDVEYLLNKAVLINRTLNVIRYTLQGHKTTSFNAYSRWADTAIYGKEWICQNYARGERSVAAAEMTEEDRKNVYENITENVTKLAHENPQITFYLFFTPYSIMYFDRLNQAGELERQLEAEKIAIKLLLDCDNIYLFSFFDNFGMVCDLDNYTDVIHYGEHINSQILKWMKEGEHRITKENYQEYCSTIYELYTTYDYDSLFVSPKPPSKRLP